jgi:hypothetical protein
MSQLLSQLSDHLWFLKSSDAAPVTHALRSDRRGCLRSTPAICRSEKFRKAAARRPGPRCQRAARTTAGLLANHGYAEPATTRGESAYLIEAADHFLAHVEEGLGTKNLVADAVYAATGKCFYREIAIDTVATIVNDLATCGALPLSVAMHAWQSCKDAGLADLTKRVRARHLHKTLELFGEQATPAGQADCLAIAREIAVAHGLDPELHVGIDVASDTPYSTGKEPMVVYAKGAPRKLSEVSFLLARLAGQTLSRVRLVFAGELREEITRALSQAPSP